MAEREGEGAMQSMHQDDCTTLPCTIKHLQTDTLASARAEEYMRGHIGQRRGGDGSKDHFVFAQGLLLLIENGEGINTVLIHSLVLGRVGHRIDASFHVHLRIFPR